MKELIRIFRGLEIERHIEELGGFRIEIFREYPYLYEGEMEYERRYLAGYLRTPQSILAVIHDEKGMKGACTGIPLSFEDDEIKKPFDGENIDEIFYIGELMVRTDARGKGYGAALLTANLQRIDAAGFGKVCLYTVDRGETHPLRPQGYRPPDCLWQKLGFEKDKNRMAYFRWKDLGQESETEKPMNVWVKKN